MNNQGGFLLKFVDPSHEAMLFLFTCSDQALVVAPPGSLSRHTTPPRGTASSHAVRTTHMNQAEIPLILGLSDRCDNVRSNYWFHPPARFCHGSSSQHVQWASDVGFTGSRGLCCGSLCVCACLCVCLFPSLREKRVETEIFLDV